jgi:hypothetical protein
MTINEEEVPISCIHVNAKDPKLCSLENALR